MSRRHAIWHLTGTQVQNSPQHTATGNIFQAKISKKLQHTITNVEFTLFAASCADCPHFAISSAYGANSA